MSLGDTLTFGFAYGALLLALCGAAYLTTHIGLRRFLGGRSWRHYR